jgi:hypothetical protein
MRANTVDETPDYKFTAHECQAAKILQLTRRSRDVVSEFKSKKTEFAAHCRRSKTSRIKARLGIFMIFGFNTDVKYSDTVYHVQSEARKADLLLQTMVFVRGHCIGKYASSYAEEVSNPGFSEEHMHDLLKSQHREIVESVRAGSIDQFFRDQTEIRDVGGNTLALTWLNSDENPVEQRLVMRLLITDAGNAIDGALVTSRLQYPAGVPIHSQAVTEGDGRVELELDLKAIESAASNAVVFVRATFGEKSVTRKYRLKGK